MARVSLIACSRAIAVGPHEERCSILDMTHPVILLFGATGDLAKRMLWPSLFHLHCDGLLPEGLRVLGTSRSLLTACDFRLDLDATLRRFGHAEDLSDLNLAEFLARVDYLALDVESATDFQALALLLADAGEILCYLSTSPSLYTPICTHLQAVGLAGTNVRLILEKPIGQDLASSRRISDAVGAIFAEDHIYRIDHYLGKETVQNLLALRFANSLFEPVWNAAAIESVQITVAETVGIEGRWSYYDDAGALRDMVQNHMLQLLALVAMEPPANLAAVRDEKVKVLQSLRPINAGNVRRQTLAGQYAAGALAGTPMPGYLQEDGAVARSTTETYVAISAYIDNWRWKGVPFFLQTGKRLGRRHTEIVVRFREVPHNIFEGTQAAVQSNRLVIRLQPEETITLELMNKQPGLYGVQLQPVSLNLSLADAFGTDRRRIAYERLLLDALNGNSTLFVRRDELEAAWTWIDGIHTGWVQAGMRPVPYAAGSAGPAEACDMPGAANCDRNG